MWIMLKDGTISSRFAVVDNWFRRPCGVAPAVSRRLSSTCLKGKVGERLYLNFAIELQAL